MTTLDERTGAPPAATVRPPVIDALRQAGRHRAAVGRARWQANYRRRVQVADAAVVLTAVAVAHLLHFAQFATSPVRADFDPVRYVLLSGVVAAVWFLALHVGGAHDVRVFANGLTEYQRVFDATWKLFGLLAVTAFLLKFPEARAYLVYAFPVGVVGLLLARYSQRQRLFHLRRTEGGGTTAVLAIGHRDQADRLIRRLHSAPGGYEVVGVCVPSGEVGPGETLLGVPVLGDLARAGQVAEAVGAEAVAVSGSDTITADVVRRLGWELEPVGVDLLLTAELADVAGPRITVTPAPGVSLLHVDAPRFEGPKFVVKQVIDWVLTAVFTLLLSPLLVLVAIAVMVDDPGTPFYLQRRVGRGGRTFTMLKFRSMRIGADREVPELAHANEADGPLFKVRADPRVTRLGRYLRRYSIDELPQLFNVLAGHMSLVGPRPPLESEVAVYGDRMRRRLLVKPGLTGLWQIEGRSDLSWEESVRLDVYYVENWTPVQDLLILLRTARAVVTGRGAY